jgi:hypothetical protein
MVLEDTRKLEKILTKNSGNPKVKYIIEKGAQHNFQYFAKRFPEAIVFLFKD